ncbi:MULTISPECIES: hypothetical protein [Nostoc cyanobionts]|uniref:hypothetical protein n=1 Tax=Nostoc cyanobionts TaxID=3123326 RepID=UPI00117E2A9E|nr:MULTISPECIES: hypothetical protein [unclassified Nostoc]
MTSSTIHADCSEDFDFEFDEQVFRPVACIGCSNYHGVKSGEHFLVCGIYPLAYYDDENRPDFINP